MAFKYQYPQWLTDAIVSAYKQGVSLEEMSTTICYPIASIRWKLTREGVYISKTNKKRMLPEPEFSF